MTEVLDTAPPDRGVYATSRQACGCMGLPEGQHLHTCIHHDLLLDEAPMCTNCGFRGVSVVQYLPEYIEACPFCGAER